MKRHFLVLLLLIVSQPVLAHKMKSAFSLVLFNERSGYLEVMHRFVLHDAEEATWKLIDPKADIIASMKTQAQFANYAVSQFKLEDQSGNEIKLDLVGFQNEGGHFWVYQDIKLPSGVTQLKVRQDVLREVWAEQINLVNIEKDKKVWSLSFSNSDEWQTVDLKK